MKVESVQDAEQALKEGLALPYALIFTSGGVTLGKTPELVNLDELSEARFFSHAREIHLFREDGIFRAFSLSDTETDSGGELVRYALDNRRLGEWIAVKSYLDFDEDGQAYVCARRLAGWKGGQDHG